MRNNKRRAMNRRVLDNRHCGGTRRAPVDRRCGVWTLCKQGYLSRVVAFVAQPLAELWHRSQGLQENCDNGTKYAIEGGRRHLKVALEVVGMVGLVDSEDVRESRRRVGQRSARLLILVSILCVNLVADASTQPTLCRLVVLVVHLHHLHLHLIELVV
jgi:hypothetical protein